MQPPSGDRGSSGRKREKVEAVEFFCPKCRATAIVYLPREPVPPCPTCGQEMMIKELLDEGKSY